MSDADNLVEKHRGILEKIEHMFTKQYFHDWYTSGRYDDYISNNPGAVTKDEILKDIAKMLRLE